MIERIELEVVKRELRDLAESVHTMELGFEAEHDERGASCMCVIKKRLEYMIIEFEQWAKEESLSNLSERTYNR